MTTILPFAPKEPETLAETGLPESSIEQLILKILYFRGDLYGQDLSSAIGLKFSLIENLVETLKLKHHLQVKRSLGMGSVGAVFGLTESGRALTREILESGQYSGPAPVPLEQYIEQVRRQRPSAGWLTKAALTKALGGMVITEHVLSQVGPAISSGNSMLVYGKPGDGKTSSNRSTILRPRRSSCRMPSIARATSYASSIRSTTNAWMKRISGLLPSAVKRRMTGAGCAASGRLL
jgi:predicted ATPase with chaperone activity